MNENLGSGGARGHEGKEMKPSDRDGEGRPSLAVVKRRGK